MKKTINKKTKTVRIDFIDEWVDDVAILGSDKFPALFRIEKVNNQNYWVCFYPNKKRSKRYSFMIQGKNLKCRHL